MQENKTKSIGRTARMRGVGGLVAGLRSRSQGNSFWDGFVNHISENWSQELAIGMAVALVTFGVSWAVQAMKQVGPHCFIAGTLVACLSADGEEIHKRIEEIEIGDRVLAYDEETGEQGYKPVARLFRNQTKEWYHVFIGGEEIGCTGEHPFYVEGKGFIPAKELKSGDKCLLSTGEDVIIEKVEVEKLTEAETTYNFEVADFHTYYVTEKDVLVHNDCITDKLSAISDKYGIGKCVEAANEMERFLKRKGLHGKRIELRYSSEFIVSNTYTTKAISETGLHVGIMYDGLMYDNIHKGIQYADWLNDFEAFGERTIIETIF